MLVYEANDNLLRGTLLRTVNVSTGVTEYLTGAATVTVTVVDAEDTPVEGQAWPLTLSYIADSQGGFLGVLRNELEWLPGDTWFADIVVDAGVDQHGEFRVKLEVMARGA